MSMSKKFQANAKKTHLSRLAPRVVVSARVVMPVRAMPSANKILCQTTTSTLDKTWVGFIDCFQTLFFTFCTMTLLARRRVIVTPMTRNTLCHPFWGFLPMNCSSLMQRRRQMEKKGRRQPLNTWATRITTRRSTRERF